MNVYGLFKIFTLGSYIAAWYTPRNHKQGIFIMYDSSSRESNNLQQISKLIEEEAGTTT